MPWLREINLDIDWVTGRFRYQTHALVKGVDIMSPHKAYESLVAGCAAYQIDYQDISSIDLHLYAACILKGDDRACTIEAPTDVKLSREEELQLPDYLFDYADVFSETAVGILLKYAEHDHAIELELGTTFLYKSIYGFTETECEVLKNYLNKAQEKDWIRLFKNPIEAFILFVLKKDGEL